MTSSTSILRAFFLTCSFWLALAGTCFAQEELKFVIRSFDIQGNSIFPDQILELELAKFRGPNKTVEDVERARSALEKYHHKQGYPTILVNIPEQTVESGVITLQVIEARIRDVYVINNRYFSRDFILKDMPALDSGKVIYLPALQEQLAKANRPADLTVLPVIIPTQKPGFLDVELDVRDELPLHGSFGFNNRATRGSTPLRFSASISYDNLWQKGHSISLQYQTSPMNMDEVQVFALSYVMPSPINSEHMVALYGVKSETERSIIAGNSVGTGFIIGGRYIIPLPTLDPYSHNFTFGLDYKDFDSSITFDDGSDTGLESPVTYVPLSLAYSGFLSGEHSLTTFSAGMNLLLRGLFSDLEEFENKRFGTTGNYMAFTGGVEHTREELPAGFRLFAKVDGQISDQPLIDNEQYAAGGMDTVRGYMESEALGDNAFHTTLEVSNSHLDRGVDVGTQGKRFAVNPFVFYDAAMLWIRDPLPGQTHQTTLQGAGVGLRGDFGNINFEVAFASALSETDDVGRYDGAAHFQVQYEY